MKGRKVQHSNVHTVTLTFFLAGLMAAAVFAWFITRPGFRQTWLNKAGWILFPTAEYWILVSSIFLIGFAAGYTLCLWKGWLPVPPLRLRLLGAAGFAGAIPLILNFLSAPDTSTAGIFLSPTTVALFLSAALFLLTCKWYKWFTVLMFLVYGLAPVVADLPHLFGFALSTWFDALTFLLRSSLLTAICGWWLSTAADWRAVISATRATALD